MNNQSGHHAGHVHQQHGPATRPDPVMLADQVPRGPSKDTVIVRQKQTVTVIFDADDPGQRLAHCHRAYHAERGMLALFSCKK